MSLLPATIVSGQGLFLLYSGIYTLFFPKKASATGPLVGTPIETVRVLSVTSLSLGTVYLLVV
ncbi:hypothetical protein BT63DRAFT_424328, partial [Microthyrium microscopicum]